MRNPSKLRKKWAVWKALPTHHSRWEKPLMGKLSRPAIALARESVSLIGHGEVTPCPSVGEV